MFTLLIEEYTLFVVAAGAGLLGLVSGAMGALSMLKRQSLLADSISHASLPGIVMAFILTGAKTHLILMIGAALAGFIASVKIFYLVNKEKARQDSMLSLVLAVYFGFGMVLLSYIQHKPNTAQAGLETFLFGQAATMLISDVKLILIISVVIVFLIILFWKEILLLIFDPVYTAASGYPVLLLESLFAFMLVGSVVIGLQTVGVVLMSAMLIIPAIAARQWTNNLKFMLLISSFIGGFSGITGSILSSIISNLPTGPAIILCAGTIVVISISFAPKRGLVWRMLGKSSKVEMYDILDKLYLLSLQHDKHHGHPVSVLDPHERNSKHIGELLAELKINGYAGSSNGKWYITEKGVEKIKKYTAGVIS